MNKARFIFFIIGVAIALMFLMARNLLSSGGNIKVFPDMAYWVWLVISIEAIVLFKLSSKLLLYTGLTITILGIAISLLSIAPHSQILGIGFLFMVMGYILNIKELVRR